LIFVSTFEFTTLFSGSSDCTVRLWDVNTHQEVAVLTGHTGAVESVAFDGSGKFLVSGWPVAALVSISYLNFFLANESCNQKSLIHDLFQNGFEKEKTDFVKLDIVYLKMYYV
jgi:WD40 repeat protein